MSKGPFNRRMRCPSWGPARSSMERGSFGMGGDTNRKLLRKCYRTVNFRGAKSKSKPIFDLERNFQRIHEVCPNETIGVVEQIAVIGQIQSAHPHIPIFSE